MHAFWPPVLFVNVSLCVCVYVSQLTIQFGIIRIHDRNIIYLHIYQQFFIWILLLTRLWIVRIMEREKKLSILYQKQGRATQFSSKAARDKWLQREIKDLERVLSSNTTQASIHLVAPVVLNYWQNTVFSLTQSYHLLFGLVKNVWLVL